MTEKNKAGKVKRIQWVESEIAISNKVVRKGLIKQLTKRKGLKQVNIRKRAFWAEGTALAAL